MSLAADYEGTFMREPISGERRCTNGSLCKMVEFTNGESGPATEFLSPEENEIFRKDGKLPVGNRMCILCLRVVAEVQF